jgi:hypothetical protein
LARGCAGVGGGGFLGGKLLGDLFDLAQSGVAVAGVSAVDANTAFSLVGNRSAEHAALIALARIVTELLQAPGPARLAELASARARLRETLVRHLKCEDWILYPRLRATGDARLLGGTKTLWSDVLRRLDRSPSTVVAPLAAPAAVEDFIPHKR